MEIEHKENIILALLVVFISMWAYTEISEYFERQDYIKEIEELSEFKAQGGRFTREDGDSLERRIEELEHQHYRNREYVLPQPDVQVTPLDMP